MSKMKTDRKPPLAKSPIRLRPRRILRSSSSSSSSIPDSIQTPPGSLRKSQKPIHSMDLEESDLRPEYLSISCELRALAKMVREEFAAGDSTNRVGVAKSMSAHSSALFERGRFYDAYSARRNERLRRKRGGETADDQVKTPYKLGVTVESSKKRESKKLESLRKSVSAAYTVERSENPRYLLRSMTKENKKPPLVVVNNYSKSVLASERKVSTARRVRKI